MKNKTSKELLEIAIEALNELKQRHQDANEIEAQDAGPGSNPTDPPPPPPGSL